MTFTIKVRGAGGPMTAEYECPVHGRFETLVSRDASGDPPAKQACPLSEVIERWHLDTNREVDQHDQQIGEPCGLASPWRISAPQLKRSWGYAEVRGGDTERRPGMLDTRPLAEGMPMKEWKAVQAKATQERRHHQLIKRGLKTRRVQV